MKDENYSMDSSLNLKGEYMTDQINDNNKNTLLILNLDKLNTTDLGVERIKRNLCLDVDDVVNWCRQRIQESNSSVVRKGKNWYIRIADCEITVNASSYTIITAHKLKNR